MLQSKDFSTGSSRFWVKNVINNNDVRAEDGAKAENSETKDHVGYFYIGDEYKNLIWNFFKYGLINGELHLTNFDNWQVILTKIVGKYLAGKKIDGVDRFFKFEKSVKNLANIANTINTIINYYKLKTAEYDNKKELLAF